MMRSLHCAKMALFEMVPSMFDVLTAIQQDSERDEEGVEASPAPPSE